MTLRVLMLSCPVELLRLHQVVHLASASADGVPRLRWSASNWPEDRDDPFTAAAKNIPGSSGLHIPGPITEGREVGRKAKRAVEADMEDEYFPPQKTDACGAAEISQPCQCKPVSSLPSPVAVEARAKRVPCPLDMWLMWLAKKLMVTPMNNSEEGTEEEPLRTRPAHPFLVSPARPRHKL
jgi:hypothetical protein